MFLLILPLLSQIHVDGISDFGNTILLIIMIVGGAMVIPAGMAMFARLFGQAEDTSGGTFLRNAYYGSRVTGALTLGLVGGTLHLGYRGARGIAHKIKHRNESGGNDSDGSGSADGGDRYSETPSAETEEGGKE